jgi:hypothetical protein
MIERKERKVFKEFPVSPLVRGCYLKKIEYGFNERNGDKFEFMTLSINKEDKWLNERYYNPVKTKYETNKAYQSARQRIRRCLEHLASTYFDTEAMTELLKNPGGTFKSYVELFKSMMEQINFTTIPIEVKTVKYNGKTKLPMAPFFIKRAGDKRIEFFYTDKELDDFKNS